jgi:hypothetical protein
MKVLGKMAQRVILELGRSHFRSYTSIFYFNFFSGQLATWPGYYKLVKHHHVLEAPFSLPAGYNLASEAQQYLADKHH